MATFHTQSHALSLFLPNTIAKFLNLWALDDILCQESERVVGRDNCVRLDGLILQTPPDQHRCHYIKAKIKARRHIDGTFSISHGPRRLTRHAENSEELKKMNGAPRRSEQRAGRRCAE